MLGFFAYFISLLRTGFLINEEVLWRNWGEKVNSICAVIFTCGSLLLVVIESFKNNLKELCRFYFYLLKAGMILLCGTLLFALINRSHSLDYFYQLWSYLLVFAILLAALSLIIFIKIFIKWFLSR